MLNVGTLMVGGFLQELEGFDVYCFLFVRKAYWQGPLQFSHGKEDSTRVKRYSNYLEGLTSSFSSNIYFEIYSPFINFSGFELQTSSANCWQERIGRAAWNTDLYLGTFGRSGFIQRPRPLAFNRIQCCVA